MLNFALTAFYEVRGCYEFNSRSCSVLLCLSVREERGKKVSLRDEQPTEHAAASR
jgi:hypothetical protein